MKVDYYDEFCKKIIQNTLWLKEHYGLSAEQMAEILCVDVKTITELENGRFTDDFTVETLFEIQEHFSVNVKVLINEYLE